MKAKTRATFKYGILAIVFTLAISQITVTGQDEGAKRSLEGVWEVKITPRNCATGEVLPALAFETLYTFYKDGTMMGSFRNNSLTLERTAAHGLWRRDHGWSEYSFKFVHLRRNVTTGVFAGKQEGAGRLVLSESGDEFTTDGFTTIFSVDGVPGVPSCANSLGIRFRMD
jgi:hypothetical protein